MSVSDCHVSEHLSVRALLKTELLSAGGNINKVLVRTTWTTILNLTVARALRMDLLLISKLHTFMVMKANMLYNSNSIQYVNAELPIHIA